MKLQSVALNEFKGINRGRSPFETKKGELYYAKNVDILPNGTISKRSPVENAYTPTGGAPYTGATPNIIGTYISSTFLFFLISTSTGVYLGHSTGTGLANTSITSAKVAIQHNSVLYIFSTSNQMATLNNTVWALNVANVNATMGLAMRDRLYIVNAVAVTDADRSRIYFSEINNFAGASGWPGNKVDVGVGDGDIITGIIEFNSSILIFKNTSTWMLYNESGTPSDWVLRKLNDTIGCVGHYTPKLIKGLVYFLSRDGVYRTDGTTFEKISQGYSIDGLYFNNAGANGGAVVWKDRYIVNTGAGTSVPWYVYNTITEAWTEWTIPVSVDRLGYHEGVDYLFFVDKSTLAGTDNKIYQMRVNPGTWTDATGNYEVQIKTGPIDFDDPTVWKKILAIGIEGEMKSNDVLSTIVTKDLGLSSSKTAATSTLVTSPSNRAKVKGPGFCRSLALEVKNTSANYFAINSIDFAVQPSNDIGKIL